MEISKLARATRILVGFSMHDVTHQSFCVFGKQTRIRPHMFGEKKKKYLSERGADGFEYI